MMEARSLEIVERDDAGNIMASYIESIEHGKARVDVIFPKGMKSFGQQLLDVFLPAGYPQSVTEDYIQYQIYDSLQAFSSSIAGLLSSRAVLEVKCDLFHVLSQMHFFFSLPVYGMISDMDFQSISPNEATKILQTEETGVGVGDASASPTAALLLSVLQESMGRIATILFAHKLGTSLEPECKMYRLAADIFNDTAMVLDCLSPAFPKPARVMVLGFSSVLRSLCGVCAGSSKASLSAHFARKGNLGELNAKDSSQETVISLLGMLAGSVVVSWVTSPMATWTTLIALLSVHLAMNYAAVTAVSMRSLNRQRANIVLSTLLQDGRVLQPTEVSKRERIFERDGVLRWAAAAGGRDQIVGHCSIGERLETILARLGPRHGCERTGSRVLQAIKLSELLRLFDDQAYILWFDQSESEARIVLKEGATPIDKLQAWSQALLLARRSRIRSRATAKTAQGQPDENDRSVSEEGQRLLAELRLTMEEIRKTFDVHTESLRNAGWDLDLGALETRPGTLAVIARNK
ncbi:DUF647-domain-containing protein, partial [Lindgomyces ingoldianus]